MTWVKETKNKPWIHRFCTHMVKMGAIPRHLAFIMDGNRRFAKKTSVDRAQGHLMGFEKLSETLEWCLDLGIKEVTVYAFSIENFKRSKEEVECLMELAREKFKSLMEERENLHKRGICIRVLGNLTLLPLDLQHVIAEAVLLTKDNNKAVLNVCFSYTSRDEICSAMKECIEGVQLGILQESDINERVIEKCLYTNRSLPPDILVRTSGEVRFSDFLLWQGSFSLLSFVQVLWPEFSLWHLYAAILYYQQHEASLRKAMDDYTQKRVADERAKDREIVIEQQRRAGNITENNIDMELQTYVHLKEARIERLVCHVQAKRDQYFQNCFKNGSCS